MSTAAIRQDLLEAVVNALPPGELSAVRSAALNNFSASGFPTTKDEDWRYTNLAQAVAVTNQWLEDGAAPASASEGQRGTADEQHEITDQIDACWLIIRNGVVDDESFARIGSTYGAGIEISRLVDGLPDNSIAIDDGMSAFNATLLQDGLHIRVSKDASMDKPLGILFTNDATSGLSQERVIIDAGENSHVRVVLVPDSTLFTYSSAIRLTSKSVRYQHNYNAMPFLITTRSILAAPLHATTSQWKLPVPVRPPICMVSISRPTNNILIIT
jgi:Fe-S cluster assembly protein SufD